MEQRGIPLFYGVKRGEYLGKIDNSKQEDTRQKNEDHHQQTPNVHGYEVKKSAAQHGQQNPDQAGKGE
jgi:hypothetical protein